jgi:hypothetical protein
MAKFRVIEREEATGKIKAHHSYTVDQLEQAVKQKPYFQRFLIGWLRRQVAKRVINIIKELVK